MVMESGTFDSWDTHVPSMIAITLSLLIAEKTEPDGKVAKQAFQMKSQTWTNKKYIFSKVKDSWMCMKTKLPDNNKDIAEDVSQKG